MSNENLRTVYRTKPGSIKNIKIVQEVLPPPAENEAQLKVKAIGLNFADISAIWGFYKGVPKGGFVPGLECSGEIVAVGSGVKKWKPGDRVMAVTKFGAYASALNIDHRYILPLPTGWTYEEGAGYLVQVLTAYYALVELGNLKSGQTVLIHSAAGGVGTWANRIAKNLGAYTIGTIGRPGKTDYLRSEGYDKILVRDKAFESSLVNALDGRELNMIMECIGGKILKVGFRHLTSQGRMVVYGASHYATPGNRPNYLTLLYKFLTRPKIDPGQLTLGNKSVMGFNLMWLHDKVNLMHDILQEIASLGIGKPKIGSVFPFYQLTPALRFFVSGRSTGKLVVTT